MPLTQWFPLSFMPQMYTHSSCILNTDHSTNIEIKSGEARDGGEAGGRVGGCSLIDSSFWSVDLRSTSCKGQVLIESVCSSMCVYACVSLFVNTSVWLTKVMDYLPQR